MLTQIFGRIRPATPVRRSLALRVLDWDAARRQVRHLEGLEPHLLRDVGLTREDVETLKKASPWDVPRHWRR